MAMRMGFGFFLTITVVVTAYRAKSSEPHSLDMQNKPRFSSSIQRVAKKPQPAGFAESIVRVPPKPPTTAAPYYGSSVPAASPDTYIPPTVQLAAHFSDSLGRCSSASTDTPPKLPANAHWIQSPTQLADNGSYISIACNPPYVLLGVSQLQCVNSYYTGSWGQCACPQAPGWCIYTASQNVLQNVDCDGDGIADWACENIDLTGIQRNIITSNSTQCQSKVATVQDCPAAFSTFPIPAVGQCFGLAFNPATSFQTCRNACAQDANCQVYQWSNSVHQCWMGQAQSCWGADKQWLGAQRASGAHECVRPSTWCAQPAIGDLFYHVDCDGDGVLDLGCANGNTGGRMASQTNCIDNWPNAVNDDCHAAFD